MKKHKILLCLEDLPFPARKNGFSIRYFPVIEHFSQKFDIDLFVMVNEAPEEKDLQAARAWCNSIAAYQRQKINVSLLTKIAKRLVSLLPYTTPHDSVYHDQKIMDNFFVKNFSAKPYDLVVCSSLTMAAMVRRYGNTKRLTIDVIDSPYALKLRSATTLLQKYDALMIKLWERRGVLAANCAAYISPLDRDLGCGKNVDPAKVAVIPNGVYLKDSSLEAIDFAGPTIGYLGHMAYPPNIQAAKRLYQIFIAIQPKIPELKLIIVGRDPVPEILELAQTPNVIVTGTVDNIWPYINGMDLFVFPMDTGSGQQNKLLEAMAGGKPVISTRLGNSGVHAIHGESVIIADSDQAIAENILNLMRSAPERERIGRNGLDFINRTYSWGSVFEQFDRTLFSVGSLRKKPII